MSDPELEIRQHGWSVRVKRWVGTGEYAAIVVGDTVPGYDPAYRDHVLGFGRTPPEAMRDALDAMDERVRFRAGEMIA
jgi:hypothetical protein